MTDSFALLIDEKGSAEPVDIDTAPGLDGALVWVHLDHADESARAWLAERAGLNGLAVDSLTATETRPRCAAIGDSAFVNLRGLSPVEEELMADPLASVRIHACGHRVYSVTRHPVNAIAAVLDKARHGLIRDSGDLIAAMADAITEELDPVVAELGDDIDDCEEMLDTRRLFELRRMVSKARAQSIVYRRFLAPQRVALEKLAGLPVDWLADDDRAHLAASADRAARMAEELDAIRDRAALLHETLTDLRAEQIDQRALTLSIVALVFLPLTFLTGLLGMNVSGIPFAHEPWAFDGVVAVCVVSAVGITAYFMRRHWF